MTTSDVIARVPVVVQTFNINNKWQYFNISQKVFIVALHAISATLVILGDVGSIPVTAVILSACTIVVSFVAMQVLTKTPGYMQRFIDKSNLLAMELKAAANVDGITPIERAKLLKSVGEVYKSSGEILEFAGKNEAAAMAFELAANALENAAKATVNLEERAKLLKLEGELCLAAGNVWKLTGNYCLEAVNIADAAMAFDSAANAFMMASHDEESDSSEKSKLVNLQKCVRKLSANAWMSSGKTYVAASQNAAAIRSFNSAGDAYRAFAKEAPDPTEKAMLLKIEGDARKFAGDAYIATLNEGFAAEAFSLAEIAYSSAAKIATDPDERARLGALAIDVQQRATDITEKTSIYEIRY